MSKFEASWWTWFQMCMIVEIEKRPSLWRPSTFSTRHDDIDGDGDDIDNNAADDDDIGDDDGDDDGNGEDAKLILETFVWTFKISDLRSTTKKITISAEF